MNSIKVDCEVIHNQYKECMKKPNIKYENCYLFYNMYLSCNKLCDLELLNCYKKKQNKS